MISRPRPLAPLLLLLLLPLLLLLTLSAIGPAPARAQMGDAGKNEDPVFKEFKGVSIGTPMDEARKKLGSPTDKGDSQDFYVFSDDETAQVFYDSGKKVSAVAVVYTGGKNVPTAQAVFGKEVAPKPDGSQFLRVLYPKVNYWVSYSRTAGDTPVTSIMMQRK
ncbi:MAG TPA: hypothetical protein VF240_19540 [Pyrinomonadaceae bacterium]